VVLLFTANPEDYTARGKIITPLKDRIGSEIRTHYPHTMEQGMEITAQEAWTRRQGGLALTVPRFIRETVEAVAFLAREDKRIDKRSGVSQRLPISVMESVISNAERRALVGMEVEAVPRVVDLYAALPSMTGKMELEYEGELKGGEAVARELIKAAVGRVFTHYFDGVNVGMIVKYFERGGALKVDEGTSPADMLLAMMPVEGLMEKTAALGIGVGESDAMRAAAAEFVLEGLYAHRRISRSEELGFMGEERRTGRGEAETEENPQPRKKRQQFN
jgi:magnesium chelatase subunit I